MIRYLLSFCVLFAVPLQAEKLDLTPVKKWVEHSASLKSLTVSFHQLRYLKTVTKPLASTGTIHFLAPDSFRLQSGEPAKLILTSKSGGNLTIQRPEKMEAEVFTREQVEAKADGHGLAFIESGFPRSMEAFQKRYEVTALTKQGSHWNVETKLINTSSKVVRKLVLIIADGRPTLSGLQIFFQDGTRMESTFSNHKENAGLNDALFVPNLTGYTIKKTK